jgi:hypothetical protein
LAAFAAKTKVAPQNLQCRKGEVGVKKLKLVLLDKKMLYKKMTGSDQSRCSSFFTSTRV